MPGFFGIVGDIDGNIDLDSINNYNHYDFINRTIFDKKTFIKQNTNNKFINDKVFEDNDDFFILIEGVILNSNELIQEYKVSIFSEAIVRMYLHYGNDFFKKFRGSFSGVFFDKANNKKIIYTNHFGEKQVYYTKTKRNNIVFGTEINYIIDYLRQVGQIYSLNKNSAYCLLSYGYMLDDNTLFNEIKKLTAGHYILIEDNNIRIINYYKIDNIPSINQINEEEIINTVDSLFRQAIRRSFEKDKEYGYQHLVALSGGLDSRMTTWVANDMGYGSNIVNYTFSQSNYLDEKISKQIASDLKHEWIFYALDNGIFLKNLEDVVKVSGGNVLYYGLSHVMNFIQRFNLEKFGIVHSGQVGGILKGYYNNNDKLEMNGSYSPKLLKKICYKNIKKYHNEGEFQLYNRQFNGTLLGNLPIQEKTETTSPFLDVDFVEYCLKIPSSFNVNEIFIKWMLTKYPDSTEYIWESINAKVTDKKINIFGRHIPLKQLPRKVISFINSRIMNKSFHSNKYNMTPLDYWFNTNQDLKSYIDDYYNNNIYRLDFDKELKADCNELYFNGNGTEKIQVLTLLAFLKIHFGVNDE
ncbi:hypothetical protein M3649_01725 [Ureibacillus chungkukjangi]|uniref:hypothetical protein n=1 Tax=Ureibacillus chungkukjangi TaxID=1202712 RepID=UPI002041EE39|nr:hypothetical protein [Ureibacillus chungkukjangi]MCM3386847.1 hypothetical protein [Ureibacillus chungkukjangi]